MTLAPACWAMRHMLLPRMILSRLMAGTGRKAAQRLCGAHAVEQGEPLRNPLRWQWVLLLGGSGVVSWWTQEWHSVFPYLIRYNVILLAAMRLGLWLRPGPARLCCSALCLCPAHPGRSGRFCLQPAFTGRGNQAGTRSAPRALPPVCAGSALAGHGGAFGAGRNSDHPDQPCRRLSQARGRREEHRPGRDPGLSFGGPVNH